MVIDKELEDLLDFAKYDLLVHKNTTFITNIVYHLKFKWNNSIPAARTNGLNLEFNPVFFKALSPSQRVFVLAHEGWHVALKHLTRFKHLIKTKQDAIDLNIAGDYVINLMCHKAGMDVIQSPVKVDGNVIFNKALLSYEYDNMSTDEVFMLIRKKRENNPSSKSLPDCPDMDDLEFPDDSVSDDEIQEIEEKINDIVINAATTARMQGSYSEIPGDIQAEIEKIISPPLPWHVIFMRYMLSFVKNDYSYSRPNRRYMPDMLLPTLHSPSIEKVVFACDISISVSDEDFSLYLSKINEARALLRPKETHIITFDTKVQGHFILSPTDRIEDIEFTGRGGTNPVCVLNYLKKTKRPDFLVFFSDMDFNPPKEDPKYPVLWIGVNVYGTPRKQNFGQYIEYSKYSG